MIIECPTIDDLEDYARQRVSTWAPRLRAGEAGFDEELELLSAHLKSCAECSRVVDQISRDNALLMDAAGALTSAGAERGEPKAPPAYELLGQIGAGGQGVVYLALHTPTRRQVAMKILGAGVFATSRQRARFEREVELAASLRHPNIVTLHDSGLTPDGRPFLVMEHVEGRSLDEFAAGLLQSDGDAARRQRVLLEVFVKICAGVSHAHARGVIHRDLKPANVLIERGEANEPRVLDFGLAKAIGDDAATEESKARNTVSGEFAGTFAYAAPEVLQRGADAADTRSDVYALGVVLYELLAGRRPHDEGAPIAEAIEQRMGAAPCAPSAVSPGINIDLDTIALRALVVDPERRYQSVESLGRDVERYLAGEPIEARRDSALYVLSKRARRHRLVLASSAAALVVMAGLSATLVVLNGRASRAQALAETRRDEATAQTTRAEKLLSISLGAISGNMGGAEQRRVSIADVAAEAAARAERELADDPRARGRLFSSLATMANRAGNAESADRYSRESLAALEQSVGRNTDEYVEGLILRAYVLRLGGQVAAAESAAREAADIARDLHGSESAEFARALIRVAVHMRDRPEECERVLNEARSILEKAGEGEANLHEHARALTALAQLYMRRDEPARAEPLLREAIGVKGRDIGPLHPRLFPEREMLARVLIDLGRLAEAESIMRELYKGRLANRGGRQTASVQATRRVLAEVLVRADRIDEALALWDEAGSSDRPHPDAAASVAIVLLRSPDGAAKAEALLKRSIGDMTDETMASGGGIEPAISMMALCLAYRGETAQARTMAEHAYRQLSRERDVRRGFWRIESLRVLIRVCELAGDEAGAARFRARLPRVENVLDPSGVELEGAGGVGGLDLMNEP